MQYFELNAKRWVNQLEKRSYVIASKTREKELLGLLIRLQSTSCVLGPVLGPENSASKQSSAGFAT